MKKTFFTALLAALLLSSCSVLGGKGIVVRADSPAGTQVAQGHSHSTTPSTSVAEHHHQPVTAHKLTADTYDGEWIIVEVGGKAVHRDSDMPYITFVGNEGRFYASNGCNVLNGDFTAAPDHISFGSVLATMRLCPDQRLEQAVNAVIRQGVSYTASVTASGQESYLRLDDTSGNTVMLLRRDNLERLNGQWAVTSVYGKSVDDPQVNLFFDIPETSVHGNTGCNYFNGLIESDPSQPNSIAFNSMSVTMRACPNAEIERALLVALEETSSYTLAGEDLTLRSRSGEVLLTLHRTLKVTE